MNDLLIKHQHVLLEMLEEVDRICKKHHISYMLFAGTLLGAVRHQGFIPWDDDLDIVMLRSEYERFLEIAPKELDEEKYYLQKEFSEHWPMFFSKLRKNKTACIERYIPKDKQIHQGIYIDIFPADNLGNHALVRRVQFLLSKIVIAKSLDVRGYLTDSMVKKIFIAFSKILPGKRIISAVWQKGHEESAMVHTFFGASSKYKKSIFPREWFVEMVELPFEDGRYPASAHYHEMLTALYGDYMTPTPEDQRGQKKHAEIVDLTRSYKEYISIQEKMQFDEYTRSIR